MSVGPITFAPGSTRETVKLVPVNNEKDDDADPVVTIQAEVTNKEAEGRDAVGAATVTIEDDDYKPGTVSGLVATAGDKMVTLQWTDLDDFDDANPSSDGKGSGGESFTYQYRWKLEAAGADDWDVDWMATERLENGVPITDLRGGVTYTFEVRAVSDAGDGEAATEDQTPTG